MSVTDYFKGAELVRMSNGDYCLVRPLGLVPGGKGMRHHENLLRLTPSGIAAKVWTGMKFGARAWMLEKAVADLKAATPPAVPVKVASRWFRPLARD